MALSKAKNNSKNVSKQEVVQIVKSMVHQDDELKWVYNRSTITNVSTSTAYFNVTSQVAQGTTALTRVGSRIKAKYLKLRISTVVGDATNILRFIVFRWRPSTTVDVPQDSEIFDGGSTVVWLSTFLNYKPSRFQILWDHVFLLDTYHMTKFLEKKILLNSDVQYDIGQTSGQDHIYCAYVSDSGAGPHPTIDFSSQFGFIDD